MDKKLRNSEIKYMQIRKIYLFLPSQMVKMEKNALENNPLECKPPENRDFCFARHYIPIMWHRAWQTVVAI